MSNQFVNLMGGVSNPLDTALIQALMQKKQTQMAPQMSTPDMKWQQYAARSGGGLMDALGMRGERTAGAGGMVGQLPMTEAYGGINPEALTSAAKMQPRGFLDILRGM